MPVKKLSLADWAKIIGTGLSVGTTFAGFVVWLTHVDTKVEGVAAAQASAVADFTAYKKARDDHESAVLNKLEGLDTRLSRIEGIQTVLLREVRRGR